MKFSRYASSITDTLYILGTNNLLSTSSSSSQLMSLHGNSNNNNNNGNSNNKTISRNKIHRLIVWLCFGFIFITLFRLIFTVTSFPYGTSLGDLMINQGYLAPNTQISSYTNRRIKLRSSNVTLLGMGKDVADNLPSVLQQVYMYDIYVKSSVVMNNVCKYYFLCRWN